jgi:hypothetical protein
VVEVTGLGPPAQRAKGKDDTLDALADAKAALPAQLCGLRMTEAARSGRHASCARRAARR